jgi:hypothetical protein
VDDEVAGLRVVDGPLGGPAPRLMGLGVVGVDADDVELGEILEVGAVEALELAAENEVKELLAGHGELSVVLVRLLA